MRIRTSAIIGVAALSLVAVALGARPGRGAAQPEAQPAGPLASAVRAATERFRTLDAAQASGYGLLHGCVSGQQEGAMGLHYANPNLVGDGELDPASPEALLYEYTNGQYQLTAVEYVVIADQWNAQHDAPPVLMGQLFNLVTAPNRYGLPAFYELHVWAWKVNQRGTFADFNPDVSCDQFNMDAAMPGMHH